jgi:hypothetical protein
VFQKPADFNIADHLAGAFGIYDGDENVTVVVKEMTRQSGVRD